jgi:putative ABC transport system permease protein
VLAYACAVTLLTALACGLLPALRASRPDLSSDLKQECGEPALHLHAVGWWRRILLAGQMLVTMVLLLAAGLLLRGLYQAETVNPGFHTTDISVVRYDLDGAGYDTASATRIQLMLAGRVSALAGITTAQARVTPLDGQRLGGRFVLDDGSPYFGSWNVVSPGYFSMLGLPIVRGRDFRASDEREHVGIAIVTESTARRFWPNADPLGQRIQRRSGPKDNAELDEVVGVVKDAQVSSLGESDSTFVYFPITPREQSRLVLLVRHAGATGATGNITNDLRAVVRDIDPQLTVTISPLEDNLKLWRGLSRLAASASGVLAGLALTLAAIGAYGVVAYSVSRRTREIGIRVALGATRGDVVRLVLGQTMQPVVVGALLGLICGAAVSRALSALLFGLSPYDPLSFVAVPLMLLVIAGLASFVPARHATRVDPLVALRYE